MISFE